MSKATKHMNSTCDKHKYNYLGLPECPLCVREERDRLRVGDSDMLNAIDDWRLRAGVAEAEIKRLREQVALLLELDEAGGKREQELRDERDRLREKLKRIMDVVACCENCLQDARKVVE